jgi:hypothetical protein
MQRMGTLLASPPELYHFFPNSFPPTIPLSTAPYTEVATFYNTSSSPAFIRNVERYVKILDEGMVEGYLGAVYGDVEPIGRRGVDGEEEGEGKKEKGSTVVMCTGVSTPLKSSESFLFSSFPFLLFFLFFSL